MPLSDNFLGDSFFPLHPESLHGGMIGGRLIFYAQIFYVAPVVPLIGMPGRGLEPLWISPPDPKSGASTNFATLANCDAHERRFVGRFRQIALVSFLRFLRQIERCPHRNSPSPSSSQLLSALRGKAA